MQATLITLLSTILFLAYREQLLLVWGRVLVLVRRERPIILPLYTKDYGHLGVRVYVEDEVWAYRIRKVTGNKTITERNIKALAGLGYRFAITTHEPMDVPTWLLDYLEEYSLLGYNLNLR